MHKTKSKILLVGIVIFGPCQISCLHFEEFLGFSFGFICFGPVEEKVKNDNRKTNFTKKYCLTIDNISRCRILVCLKRSHHIAQADLE